MKTVVRFELGPETKRERVEELLALAIVVAECLHGKARVRLGTGYLFSDDGRQLVLDATSEVGEYVAELFTGLLIREIGEEAFSVQRAEKVVEAASG